jgi:SagB-type dehydrogenase family enzyme
MKRVLLITMAFALLLSVVSGQSRSRKGALRMIQLPQPKLNGPVSLEQALAKRRSIRSFSSQALSYQQLGQLAWAAQGITEQSRGLRTAPSAGAIYPVTLYLATEQGLFVYNPQDHTLVETIDKDIRIELSKAALNQRFVAQAACDIIIAGSVKDVAARYGKKARTYTILEAGHIAQNVLLQAVTLDLAAVPVGAFNMGPVKRLCRMTTDLEPFYIIPVGYPATPKLKEGNDKGVEKASQAQKKKAVFIIARSKFRDQELFETLIILEDVGVQTTIASSRTGTIRGIFGGKAQSQILIGEIDVNDFDAVIFVGGSGAHEYFDNTIAHNIVRQAKAKEKVLAAIGIAPAILANAGVLKDVRATVFRSQKLRLRKSGAEFVETKVQRDGLIITASGPEAVKQFGRTIAEALNDK